jgi:hypothetical protein
MNITSRKHTPQLYDEASLWELQNPGCHTGCGGCGYVAHYNEADEEIDKFWARELHEARKKLIETLRKRK